jgi:large subunit ribosomal protein L10
MRPEKQSIIQEISGNINLSEYAFLVNYQGMKVDKLTELRTALRKVKSRLMVVNNSFLRIAADAKGANGVLTPYLSGPVAVVTGSGDPVEVAKVISQFSTDNPALVLKGGLLGLQGLPPADVAALAKLPSRHVLLGRLVGTLAAPMSQLVGVFQQKVASVLYVLRAIEGKKSGSA